MLNILYPSDDYKSPADIYITEQKNFEKDNFATAIFDFNTFFEDTLKIKPKLEKSLPVLYRGWMLSEDEYSQFYQLLIQKAYQPLTTPKQYLNTHYLPNWYNFIQEFTPKTVFTDNLNDIEKLYRAFGEKSVFVKDFVKSDTTSQSIAHSTKEIYQIIDNLKKFRGKVDGGICLRQVLNLKKDSEERYFVFNQQAFSRDGIVPNMVREVAKRIDSPFFSIDTCFDVDGKLWIIELGDGQVSDIKKWQIENFVKIFIS